MSFISSDDDWKTEVFKLLIKLNSKKESEFFREPVNWEELGLLDYPKIIKNPMDLQTVKYNLEGGLYRNEAEAAADIRLITLNAMTYNSPGSRVYVHAKSLSDFFESNSYTIFRNMEDLDKPANNDEMTHFVDKCHRISPEDLGRVLKYLDSVCPNCLVKRVDSNEVEVNVDLITGKVFREASSIVNAILPDIMLASSNRRSSSSNSSTNKIIPS